MLTGSDLTISGERLPHKPEKLNFPNKLGNHHPYNLLSPLTQIAFSRSESAMPVRISAMPIPDTSVMVS
jgi:hypothetical protein